jgi:WD40 repeat protein
MDTPASRPNPYVGPRAFQTGEVLYGRDQDILNLYYLLLAERVVLFFSPSGAGKSSLIQAGLIPRLTEKFSFIPIIRVNQEPPEAFSKTPGFNRYIYSALLSLEESALPDQRLPAENLAALSFSDYLNQRIGSNQPQTDPPRPVFEALIFDQFEEILTTAPNDYEGKQVFFDQVGAALHDRRLWALFSAREDYAASFEPYLRAIPTRFANRYRLDLLEVEMALQAIQKPAREVGVEFTDAAARKLVDDLRRVQTQLPDGATEFELGRYVEPVQLQVVCYRLWNNLSADETAITEKQLASIGSVNESLSAYYTDQVAAAEQKFQVPQRLIREWFNNQLITKQGMRSQVRLEPDKSGGLDNRVINFMESAHLVRAEKRAGSIWFELSHDRLIEPIRTGNENWLKTNLSLVQQQADLWNQQDRPDSLLLREKELAQARLWAEAHSAELLPNEKDFLLACKAEEDRALRLKRRTQIIHILGLIATLLAIVAFAAYRQADFQRKEAQRQERVARAGQLAAQSHTALDEFPQRSLLLALEALKTTQNENEPAQASAADALRAALDLPHGQPLGRQDKPLTTLAFSSKGSWLATGSEDGSLLLWDRRAANTNGTPIRLVGPGGAIRALAFSPDEKWLAAGGDNKIIFLWDLANPAAAAITLSGHTDNLKSLAFDPASRWLATGSIDETIRLWDLRAADPSKSSHVLTGHSADVSSLAFSPDGLKLASGSLDGTVRLWDMNSPDFTSLVLKGHTSNVNVLAFSPATSSGPVRWLASGSFDHTIRLWDLQSRDPAAQPIVLTAHEDQIFTLAFSPDAHWLATGSADHTIRLWNMQAPDPSANPLILRGHTDAINTLAFSPDGHRLATGSADHSIRLWDMQASDPAAAPGVLRGHDDQVSSLAFSPDGFWLASASRDNSSRLWDLRSPSPAGNPAVLHTHTDQVNALAVSSNGRWLASGSSDKNVLLWDLRAGIPPFAPLILQKHNGPVNVLALSPSGRWLASAGLDANILVWDLDSANPSLNPLELRGHEKAVSALAFNPDLHWLASGSSDGSVRLWDLAAGTSRSLGIDADHDVTALAFDPSGKWLAAGSGFIIRLWSMDNPDAAPLQLAGHENRVTSLVFSPDGHWLITGSMDKTVRLWNLRAADPTATPTVLTGHTDWVNALAVSPDGHWLASGSRDKTALLWDLSDLKKAPISLRGHDDEITLLAFSPDNHWLATAGLDRTIRLWDLQAENPASDPQVLRGHEDTLTALAFIPGGKWLVSASTDHTVRFWQLQLDELKTRACHTAGRNLTVAEWEQVFSNRVYEITCVEWPPGN